MSGPRPLPTGSSTRPVAPLGSNPEHVTAHVVSSDFRFLAGCGCGWVGPLRGSLQACVYDRIRHETEARA